MSFVDKAKNKVEETVGKAKEIIGEKTGNEKLEAEGRADQGKAGDRIEAKNGPTAASRLLRQGRKWLGRRSKGPLADRTH